MSKMPRSMKLCSNCGQYALIRDDAIYCSRSCASQVKAQSKFNNSNTTGDIDRETYLRAHHQLKKLKTKTKVCSICKESRFTHWAHLYGSFFDPDNYVELCVPCHIRFDRRRVAVL